MQSPLIPDSETEGEREQERIVERDRVREREKKEGMETDEIPHR